MSNTSAAVRLWRQRTKTRIVESFGGKCNICSYNRCQTALELHHLDPSKKNFFCYDCSTEDGTRFEYFFSKEDIYAEDWKVYSRE